MAEEIKVVYVKPGEKPEVIQMEHTLKKMQELVGGNIQSVYPWEDPVALVCNDEGKFNGSLPNRMLEDYDVLFGPFFICGLGEESLAGLSDEMAEKYMQKFMHPEIIAKTQDGKIVSAQADNGEIIKYLREF